MTEPLNDELPVEADELDQPDAQDTDAPVEDLDDDG